MESREFNIPCLQAENDTVASFVMFELSMAFDNAHPNLRAASD